MKPSHANVSRKKGVMTYYCLPPMLHEMAFVGVQRYCVGGWFKSTHTVTELAYDIVGNEWCGSFGKSLTTTVPLEWGREWNPEGHKFWCSLPVTMRHGVLCTIRNALMFPKEVSDLSPDFIPSPLTIKLNVHVWITFGWGSQNPLSFFSSVGFWQCHSLALS